MSLNVRDINKVIGVLKSVFPNTRPDPSTLRIVLAFPACKAGLDANGIDPTLVTRKYFPTLLAALRPRTDSPSCPNSQPEVNIPEDLSPQDAPRVRALLEDVLNSDDVNDRLTVGAIHDLELMAELYDKNGRFSYSGTFYSLGFSNPRHPEVAVINVLKKYVGQSDTKKYKQAEVTVPEKLAEKANRTLRGLIESVLKANDIHERLDPLCIHDLGVLINAYDSSGSGSFNDCVQDLQATSLDPKLALIEILELYRAAKLEIT